MIKYNKRILNKIMNLIKSDSYTIAEICVNVGISESCYYKWQAGSTEFTENIQKAKDEYIAKKLNDCQRSLDKLINGYEYEEKKTITVDNGEGRPKIKEQTITKKQVSPNLGAIIHFQTNKDPQNWKNRQSAEVTGKDGKDLIPARVLTSKEAQEFLSQLEDEC
jgi:transposase